jgi:hypothetical protein
MLRRGKATRGVKLSQAEQSFDEATGTIAAPRTAARYRIQQGYAGSSARQFKSHGKCLGAPFYHGNPLEILLGFKHPQLGDRRSASDAAKKAMLEKFRAALQDPVRAERRATRLAIHEARLVRMAEREAAKKAAEAKLAAQAARELELANQAAREAEEAKTRLANEEFERAAALQARQKAERDARYAARKADKKVRRRGF